MKYLFKILLIITVLFFSGSSVNAAIDGSNILITEIMPDAVESGVDNEFEWAELYNPTNTAIDINGWEIIDGAGNDHTFDSATDNTVIGPGEYRLLILDATDTPPNGKTDTNSKSFEIGYPGVLAGLPTNSDYIDLVEAIKLNNTGDSLELCTAVCDGTNQVDYVEWEDFSSTGLWNDDAGNGTGNAICRDGIIDTNTEADWSVTACNTDPTETINDGNPGTGTYGTYDVTIVESAGSTTVLETGPTSDTYTIVLESSPSATETITVAISPDVQCSADLVSVTFDNTDWNIPQTVTITAVDDGLVETTPHTCAITHTTTSSNITSGYHMLTTDGISVDVDDNDAAGFTITQSGGDTSVDENGPTNDTFDIVLDTDPGVGNDVAVMCTTDGELTITASVMPLVFNTSNYISGFTVNVEAIDDSTVESSPHVSVVICEVISSDNLIDYPITMMATFNVDVADNDVAAPTPSTKSKSSIKYTCKDESALNYNRFGRHKESLCEYTNNAIISINTIDALAENVQCPYFTEYHRNGDTQGEVTLIQTFLNQYYEEGLDIDGIYGQATSAAVSRFQLFWQDEVLRPWGLQVPTSRWYQSTKNKANEVAGCDEGEVRLDNGVIVN